MKLITIFVLICLTTSLAFAQEQFERILITKTQEKSNLSKIKRTLDSIHVKMYVQALPSAYYVYSKNYMNPIEARETLTRVKTKFPYAKILLINSPKNKIIEDEAIEDEIVIEAGVFKNESSTPTKKTNIFINLSLGYVNLVGKTNDLATSQLANTGMSYIIEGGYILNDNWSATVAYLNASTSDISAYDIYGEMNYMLNLNNRLSIGGGLILGVSSLEIDSFASSTASINVLYGYDLALAYKYENGFNIFTKYQGLYKNHKININSTADISFDYTHNTLVGIGYIF